ncbi:Lrp/AsnC family transcriptional regulator [Rhizobium leucaenae]|uniref:DNA-binding Lrp family transcriptional regulator n=1 Tax=Rhizobium leucaenae TaxID=29450 RepID=A0A7W7EKM9_9HYPH|nr:Lrp/AsnC family transcriptional regulator [Rhizobium leucaenae]MBB4569041.1 DNA-binding Lrp family transcriptional regulator [Rhizobium leucaenae]MBB6299870.1 DNA-binding Lrp family transcriptional regulator [Rhizobium leucaenae]
MPSLDAIDRNIIRLLRLDARTSNAKLAEDVGLSPSACMRRIKIMEESGVIRGYTALVDTSNVETSIAVIINITLERQTEDHLDRFEAAVRRYPEIRECFLMTGGSDYLLRVEVANAGDFERIHKEILSTLPGVLRIHSSFSIRNVLATKPKRGTRASDGA